MQIRTNIHIQGNENIEVAKLDSLKCYCVKLGEYNETCLYLHDDNAKKLAMALVEEMTRGVE